MSELASFDLFLESCRYCLCSLYVESFWNVSCTLYVSSQIFGSFKILQRMCVCVRVFLFWQVIDSLCSDHTSYPASHGCGFNLISVFKIFVALSILMYALLLRMQFKFSKTFVFVTSGNFQICTIQRGHYKQIFEVPLSVIFLNA